MPCATFRLTTLAAGFLLGCGTDPNKDPEIDDAPYPGVPAGPPVVVSIGPAGGVASTADGAITVTIPAGALARQTDITIRPLVPTAPQSFGNAYRIEPANLAHSKPIMITLQVAEDLLGQFGADGVGIAYRRPSGVWRADLNSTSSVTSSSFRPAGSLAGSRARTVSVTRVEGRGLWVEYAVIAFWALLPHDATIATGSSIPVRALACLKEVETSSEPSGEEETLEPLPICRPSIREATWTVDGVTNGNNNVGVVSTGTSSTASEALYLAPNTIPASNPVRVNVSLFWRARGLTKTFREPIPIRVVGGDFVGGASGSVASGAVGTLYDYVAAVTWRRVRTNGAVLTYQGSGYLKYTARHRCISNMRPDSIPISPAYNELTVDFNDSTWAVTESADPNQGLIRYYDTCAKQDAFLEVNAAPFIDGFSTNPLPIRGQINVDAGLKINATYNYAREGDSPSPIAPTAWRARTDTRSFKVENRSSAVKPRT